MSSPAPTLALRPRAVPWWAVLGVGVGAASLGVLGSWASSLWFDEGATILSAQRSWESLARMIQTVDLVHAAYYSGMKLWFELVGATPFTLRLPSALAMGAAASVTVLLVERLLDARAALIAGALLGVLPRATWAAVEGRSVALTVLLAAVLTLLLLFAIWGRRRALAWALYTAIAVFSVYLFMFTVLLVLAHAVAVLALWAMRRVDRTAALRMAVSGATVLAVTAPFMLAVSRQSGQVEWISPLGANTIRKIALDQFFMSNAPLAAVVGAVLVVAVVQLWRTERPWLLVLLGSIILVPVCTVLLISVLVQPMYVQRYMAMTIIALAALIAVPLASLRRPVLLGAALTALVALCAPQYVAQRTQPHTNSPWLGVAEIIAAQTPADGRTGVAWGRDGPRVRTQNNDFRVIADVYPWAFANVTDPTLVVPVEDADGLWPRIRPIGAADLVGLDRVWLVDGYAPDTERDAAVLTAAGFAPVQRTEVTYIGLELWERAR